MYNNTIRIHFVPTVYVPNKVGSVCPILSSYYSSVPSITSKGHICRINITYDHSSPFSCRSHPKVPQTPFKQSLPHRRVVISEVPNSINNSIITRLNLKNTVLLSKISKLPICNFKQRSSFSVRLGGIKAMATSSADGC